MRTVLKGSPQWSIDTNGVITITTTWMCLVDEGAENVLTGWLNFQNEVEKFAGKAGDAYKKPVQSSGTNASVEITEYETSELFKVQDVQYQAVEGRTHYDVTFTNLQNFDKLTLVGGINASINENNERTKTAEYRASIDTPQTIDGEPVMDELLLESGTEVKWAGASYLIESTEYTAESPTQYIISITAKDMSRMMIGLPQENTDSFGNKTITAVWRFSRDVYDSEELPAQGTDASAWIGNKDGFIIQSIDAQSHGVLGYNITITAASHRTNTRISSNRTDTKDAATGNFYTEWESQFQTDAAVADELGNSNLKALDVHDFIPEGMSFPDGTIRDVSYDEYVTGKYNVRVRMSNAPETDTEDFEDQWDATVTQEPFKLELGQTGWAKSPSGELYQVNFPPATKFTYVMATNSIIEMQTVTGGTTPSVSQDKLLQTIKSRGTIGFDRIVGVQAFVGDNLKWLSPTETSKLTKLTDVQSVMLEGFVFAQPTMTTAGQTLRNILFTPWRVAESCPIIKDDWKQTQNRDNSLNKKFVTYTFHYHNIQVTLRYKVKIKNALKEDVDKYYKDAIKKIKCNNYTSYKGAGISYKAVSAVNNYGELEDYTEVTCSIYAWLRSNAGDFKWNAKYDNSVVM
jgi:hypothetical protein